jgi:beta-galactosidase
VDTLTFEVTGAGRLIAADNANLSDNTPVQSKEKKAYQGRAVAVVRSGAQPGKLTVRVVAPGLAAGEAVLTVEPQGLRRRKAARSASIAADARR